MKHFLWVPDNLDLDSLLQDYDFTDINGFHKDNLCYILHLINEIPSCNKDIITETGYVPLHSVIMRKWLYDYSRYINCLLEIGVLETDNVYILGEKAKGYRYAQRFRTGLKRMLVTDGTLIKKLTEWRSHKDYSLGASSSAVSELSILKDEVIVPAMQYNDVARWYNTETIEIDASSAHAYNRAIYEYKRLDQSRWDKKPTSDGSHYLKDPYTQYIAGWRSIEKVKDGVYNLHADGNIYRLHSCITNCKKELRHFITIKGQLVRVTDLSNSQPTLLLILLNPDFWDGTGRFNYTNIPYLDINSIFSNTTHIPILIKLLKNLQHNESSKSELIRFREMVLSGRFYEDFATLIKSELGIEYSREDIKPLMFTVLFTSNRFISQPGSEPKQIFKRLFPSVYDILRRIKQRSANNLPILLQRIESYIMYYRICPAIALKTPDLPIIPIHDSIATIKGQEDVIEAVMKQQLAECLGAEPHLKFEDWDMQTVMSSIQAMAA